MENSLMQAAQSKNNPQFEALIRGGADINAEKTGEGKTILMVLSELGVFSNIRLAIKHGVALDIQDDLGMTALMYAAQGGNLRTVDVLLSAGADTSLNNKEGLSASALALIEGHTRIVSTIKQSDENGSTSAVENEVPEAEPEAIEAPVTRPRMRF